MGKFKSRLFYVRSSLFFFVCYISTHLACIFSRWKCTNRTIFLLFSIITVLSGIYKRCLCLTGFTGVHCEQDFYPCSANPCFPGVNCTNNMTDPLDRKAECGLCPSGFEGDGQKCVGMYCYRYITSGKFLLGYYCRGGDIFIARIYFFMAGSYFGELIKQLFYILKIFVWKKNCCYWSGNISKYFFFLHFSWNIQSP